MTYDTPGRDTARCRVPPPAFQPVIRLLIRLLNRLLWLPNLLLTLLLILLADYSTTSSTGMLLRVAFE